MLQEIGADETVNYREQDFAEVYKDKPFDYIFDSVGGNSKLCSKVCMLHHSRQYTRWLGNLAIFVPMRNEAVPYNKELSSNIACYTSIVNACVTRTSCQRC